MSTPYLISHPPRQRQFRARRAKPTGLIVVHTAESAPDTVGPDDGTINVARFIQGRSDYGSYHWLADSDSRLQLVPYHMAAYGDGTGSNEFAIHVSAATQAHRWPSLPKAWREGAVKQMAAAAAESARWLKREHGITVPARRVNLAESNAGKAGFISHGERDPGRRSDPGAAFPWKMFLDEFARLMAPEPQVEPADRPDTGTLADKDKPEAYFVGARGPHVKWLADRLVAHGFKAIYKNGTDRYFTEGEDRKAVRAFQEAQGWTGSDADGLPGPETLRRLALDPKVEEPEPTPEPEPVEVDPTICVTRLRIAHISMQFSDTTEQKAHDVAKLFERALNRGWAWFTGTEAGGKAGKDLSRLLEEAATENGFRFHIAQGEWVCVKRDLIVGGWETGFVPVLDPSSSKTGSRHSGRGICWVAFDTESLGRISIGASHYLTKGRKKGDPNYALNTRLTEAIGDWGRDAGQGTDLVFYHGDQNIVDRRDDTFRGQPFTTLWDELEKWQATGHGNIDVIATWDRDARVEAVAVEALDDKRFFLYTDHFLIEGEVDIRHLAA